TPPRCSPAREVGSETHDPPPPQARRRDRVDRREDRGIAQGGCRSIRSADQRASRRPPQAREAGEEGEMKHKGENCFSVTADEFFAHMEAGAVLWWNKLGPLYNVPRPGRDSLECHPRRD